MTAYQVNPCIEEFDCDTEVEECYPFANLKLIRSYNRCSESLCFNYALKNYYIDFREAYTLLVNIYQPIALKNMRVGDIVTYHDYEKDNFDLDDLTDYPTDNNVRHYGKVVETDGTLEGTVIRSKWGDYGIFETDLDGVCIEYGENIVFWRRGETNET